MIKGSYATNFDTPLTEDQEAEYQKYKSSLGEQGTDEDYDLRGFWLEHGEEPHEKGAHFIDKYKKPNHPTFSDQSQYHGADNGMGGIHIGGSWVGDTGYIPPAHVLNDPKKMASLQRYMYEAEGGKVNIIDKPQSAVKSISAILKNIAP